MKIRLETAADRWGIRAVAEEAFPTRMEADLVDRLRADGDMVFSLVAVVDDDIVGHAVFSMMRMPTGTLGLGPVAVLARHRRQGIAANLIREGLRRAREEGWKGVFVVGNPDYYSRFGFDSVSAAVFASPYAGPNLLALALQSDGLPSREASLEYPAAFAALS